MLPITISALLQPEAGACGVGLGSRETERRRNEASRGEKRGSVRCSDENVLGKGVCARLALGNSQCAVGTWEATFSSRFCGRWCWQRHRSVPSALHHPGTGIYPSSPFTIACQPAAAPGREGAKAMG